MKISVITLHRVFNYGSVFQTYATQKIFERKNAKVEIIDYYPERFKFKNLIKSKKSNNIISAFKEEIMRAMSMGIRHRQFGKFLNKYVNLTKKYLSYEDLKNNPPKADMYVTGSDQCWNSYYNGVDKCFYLAFGDKSIKRASFATSVGNEKLSKDEEKEIGEYLSKYDYISVREEVSVKLLENITKKRVVSIIDPTLQLKAEEWNKLASKPLIKSKYVLLFLLYGEDLNATEYARRIADEKNLILVELSWKPKRDPRVDKHMSHRIPADFLALVRDAEYVVTNSFHGLAFSVNYNKQFTVVERSQFNNRISELLKILGLSERAVNSYLDMNIVNKKIDYKAVNAKLEQERKKASDFVDVLLGEVK